MAPRFFLRSSSWVSKFFTSFLSSSTSLVLFNFIHCVSCSTCLISCAKSHSGFGLFHSGRRTSRNPKFHRTAGVRPAKICTSVCTSAARLATSTLGGDYYPLLWYCCCGKHMADIWRSVKRMIIT